MKIIFKCEGCGLEWAKPTDAVKCEERHKEVGWYEAMRAWLKGATIRMEKNGYVHEVCTTELVSIQGVDFNRSDFEHGKWFIEAKS